MAVNGIDFACLTLVDGIDLAILIEDEAEDRYLEFADQMEQHRTPGAAAFFRFMASNEAKHAAWLRERREAMFGDALSTVRRSMLWDVEAPDYDQVRAFMTAREAMQAALEAERKAHDFFVGALEQVTDESTRALFNELREEELLHQRLVTEEIAKLAPDPPGNADDFADEPTAQ